MKLYLIVDVSPEDSSVRTANSELVRDELESEIEGAVVTIDDETYLVAVLGSGKTEADARESMRLRRQALGEGR